MSRVIYCTLTSNEISITLKGKVLSQGVVQMIRSVCVCLAGVIMLCGIASVASAKVWLLPDYQQRQLYSHRVNNNEQGSTNKPQVVKCQNYGLIPASEIEAGMTCDTKRQIMHLTCYGNCHCPSSYDETEASCRLEGKIPGGSSCAGEYYTTCICDTSLYPHTSSSCAYTLSGASCSDENGKHYAECVNPCEGLTDNETDLGCEKYYSECPSKCEVGKTCVPNDCSDYALSSCPSGYTCESCTPGCGETATKYKKTGCDNTTIDVFTEEELINVGSKKCQKIYIADNITISKSLYLGYGTTISVARNKVLQGKNGSEIDGIIDSDCFSTQNSLIGLNSGAMLKDIRIHKRNYCSKKDTVLLSVNTSSNINVTLDNVIIEGEGGLGYAIEFDGSGEKILNATNVVIRNGQIRFYKTVINDGNFLIDHSLNGTINGGNFIFEGFQNKLFGTINGGTFIGRLLVFDSGEVVNGGFFFSRDEGNIPSLRVYGSSPITKGTFYISTKDDSTFKDMIPPYTAITPTEYEAKRESVMSQIRSTFEELGFDVEYLNLY